MKHSVSALVVLILLIALPQPASSSDAEAMLLEWSTPPLLIRSLGDGLVAIDVEGYAETAIPGRPRLPFTSTLLALPPGAPPQVHILATEEFSVPLPGPIVAATQPSNTIYSDGSDPLSGGNIEPRPVPSAPVALEEIGVVRGIRLARIYFYPAIPQGTHLRIIRYVKAIVDLPPPYPSPGTADPLVEQVRRAVINPRHVISPPAERAGTSHHITGGGMPTAFLEVSRPGLYRLTREQVAEFGFAYAVPRHLRLFRGSEEVAFEWLGDDDDTFEEREAILFYAEPRFSRWTATDVYRLTADETPGLSIPSRNADPAGLPAGIPWTEETREVNEIYTPDCLCGPIPAGRDGDRWVWADLRRPGRSTFSTTLALTSVRHSQPASLNLWLIGYTSVAANPDHRVDVLINGTSLGQVEWDGRKAVTATLAIPAGLLTGTNTLALALPGIPGVSVEGVWLDSFAVHYALGLEPVSEPLFTASPPFAGGGAGPTLPNQIYLPLLLRGAGMAGVACTITMANDGPYLAYDVTDPLHPIRLTDFLVEGRTVTAGIPPGSSSSRHIIVAANEIRTPERIRGRNDIGSFQTTGGGPTGAEYLIITHPAFSEAATWLARLRRDQGLATFIANVLGIYDVYGDGRPDPEAIRAFIADAYANWTPRPVYVVLLGDGTFDPRQYRADTPPTFIPPYLAPVDPWAGETAADNRYACVDGNDNLPDVFIGRLPVKSAHEAQETARKLIEYETDPFPGGWNAHAILVADDQDSAGNFPASSDKVAIYITTPFTVTRRYCSGSSPSASDCPPAEAETLHTAILNDWNRGALLIQFTGHASWHQWAVERLFHLEDIAALSNGRRLPVVVEMSCFTGAFHRPEPVLDEALVTLPGGGALATWGQTGLGVGTGHSYLAEGFFRAFFAQGVLTPGEAAMAGKMNLAASGLYPELQDTFTLLGDPASRINRTIVPWAQQVFLPFLSK